MITDPPQISSTTLSKKEKKRKKVTDLNNHTGVCRTALATPGLLTYTRYYKPMFIWYVSVS